MTENNNLNNKSKFNIGNLIHGAGFSSLTAALMAILLGLIFGFLVMLVAKPGSAITGFKHILLGTVMLVDML